MNYDCPRKTIDFMLGYPSLPYNFTNIPYVSDMSSRYVFYLLDEGNRKIALRDILYVNDLWIEAMQLFDAKDFIFNEIIETDIVYEPERFDGKYTHQGLYTYFYCYPNIENKKTNRFPMILHAHIKRDAPYKMFRADLSYLSDGSLGKILITYDEFKSNSSERYYIEAYKKEDRCRVTYIQRYHKAKTKTYGKRFNK